MITSVLAVVLVLGGLIFFHELGHFLVARAFGVGVSTFSLGFGKKLFGVTRGRTEYKISAIPLGGYVHMVGEQVGVDMPEGFYEKDSFALKPGWQKMLIVAAGPVSNFILAILIYWMVFLFAGQPALKPVIGGVLDDSPAAQAQLQAGDTVTAIDGQPIQYWSQMVERITGSEGQSVLLTVDRGGQSFELELTPKLRIRKTIFGEEEKVPMIGVQAAQEVVVIPQSPASALTNALDKTWDDISLTAQSIVKVIERIVPMDQLGGPILIAQAVGQSAKQGLVSVLALAAFISVNLGFFNLLPIPVLDGGHILFFAIETVIGRPLSPKLQAVTIRIGLTLLLSLIALVIYNDIARIVTEP